MAGFAETTLPEDVAAGVLRGNRKDVARAYEILSQPVMNLAMGTLKDRQLAEEVVQDVFIELLEKSAQIRQGHAVRAWIKKVAVNHCLMRLRSPWHKRRSLVTAEVVLEGRTDEGATEADFGETEYLAAMPGLERALSALPVEARAVLWLHDVEGYTHKEIGQLMGKTSSFSKSQLARAYQRLLRMLDPEASGAENPEAAGKKAAGKNVVQKIDAAPENFREVVHERRRTGKNIEAPCPS